VLGAPIIKKLATDPFIKGRDRVTHSVSEDI
jgi:hypothetical protein